MTFGAQPISTLSIGAATPASRVYTVVSLGCVAVFGTPYVAVIDSLHEATSLGTIATFGTFSGAGAVFNMRSLGVVARFGGMSAVGNVGGTVDSMGYVVRFGHLSAIRFKQRAAA